MSDKVLSQDSAEQFLSGGGEMGKLIRSMDWSATALGAIETWPQSLRTSVSLCLSSTFPILIAWGPETIQIYNDSYRPICGAKHPESMGQNFRICWETALPVVGDAFTRGQHGEGTYIKDQRMFLDRYGYLEEAFMTFSFAPIRDESGEVGGIFHPITETTDKMLSARRTQSLRELGIQISKAKSIKEICERTSLKYEEYMLDLPFVLFYQASEDGMSAKLKGRAGLAEDTALAPALVSLAGEWAGWPFANVFQSEEPYVVEHLTKRFGNYACGPYDAPPETALILPVHVSGQENPFGYLVAGVSICRALDRDYENFYDLLVSTFNTAVSNVYAYEQEQKRAEALAAIDRSKTAFFSNVSHEFRTPLTLMLGPLEDLLSKRHTQEPGARENIESAHRNALRLLKLVNNLLDYSRVEADRVKAMYQPVDLAVLTEDLASSFRSIIEKAGMQLQVYCQPLAQPVFADMEMWEKIVLNLLSNAFKYTLAGSITVTLHEERSEVVLTVADTGIGIPEKDLPHMFERFHRVAQSAGRTHEGTGIGLSLVHELVKMHGGTISVASAEGTGSTFMVRMPVGRAHLPEGLVSDKPRTFDTSSLKGAFLKEASSLLEEEEMVADIESHETAITGKRASVLVADDNSDMRAYLARLLEPHFNVHTAHHGADALLKVNQHSPDLIISDIMMPVMDGKELLGQLKGNPGTANIPLIFLSARAGEEARIDGLEAGADDYLIKPFSANELLSKVRAQIRLSQSRNHTEQQLRNLFTQAPVAIAIYKGPEYIISVANEMMLQIWGKTTADVMGKPLFDALPELRGQGFEDLMKQVYDEGTRVVTDEIPVDLFRNGHQESLFIKLTVEALREEDGIISGIMVVASEVTNLVNARIAAQTNATELEERVGHRTRELHMSNLELMRTNHELEQYAYVTSHDLQEPLRKIRVFSSMLQALPQLPLSASPLLSKVLKSSERMTVLINDLLTFSRLLKIDSKIEETDLGLVLEQVLADFDLAIEEKGATIQMDTLPVVAAVGVQMNQLFTNLIGNALKFTREGVPPRIAIRIRELTIDETPAALFRESNTVHYLQLSFEDNGIGFDPKYSNQIFEVFKRLHSHEEYSGSGIGLALCRRIVQNHKGMMFAESVMEEGTTVKVILPVQMPAQATMA